MLVRLSETASCPHTQHIRQDHRSAAWFFGESIKPPKGRVHLCGTMYELSAGDTCAARGREHMPRRVLNLREAEEEIPAMTLAVMRLLIQAQFFYLQ